MLICFLIIILLNVGYSSETFQPSKAKLLNNLEKALEEFHKVFAEDTTASSDSTVSNPALERIEVVLKSVAKTIEDQQDEIEELNKNQQMIQGQMKASKKIKSRKQKAQRKSTKDD